MHTPDIDILEIDTQIQYLGLHACSVHIHTQTHRQLAHVCIYSLVHSTGHRNDQILPYMVWNIVTKGPYTVCCH